MRRLTFPEWLEHRVEEIPDTGNLALVIARSGGISRDDLLRIVRISPETLEDLLRALMTTGQIVALKVGGQRVYRAVI